MQMADFHSRWIGDAVAEGICGSGLVDLLSELLRNDRINSLGRFEHGEERLEIDVEWRGPGFLTETTSTNWRRQGANVAGLPVIFNDYGIGLECGCVLSGSVLAGILNVESSKRTSDSEYADSKIVQVGMLRLKARASRCCQSRTAANFEVWVKKVTPLNRLETHHGYFRFLCGRLPVKPVESAEICADLNGVSRAQPKLTCRRRYKRLLGFPANYVFEGRVRELVDWPERGLSSMQPWIFGVADFDRPETDCA